MVWHIRHAAGAKGNNSNDANRNANNNDDKHYAGSGHNSFRGKDSSSSDGNSSSSRSSGRSGRKYLRSDSNRRRSRNRYEEVLRERYGGSSLCGGENKSN